MQDIIRTLNDKGYKTRYCCESHSKNMNMYISFYVDYGFGKHLPMPDGFKYKYGNTIDFMYKSGTTDEEYVKQKNEHLDSLNKWCKSLPYMNS